MSVICVASISVSAAIVIAALARAVATPRASPPAEPLPDSGLEEAAGVEDALSAVVKRPTVSYYDRKKEDDAAFAALKRDLVGLFPKVHEAMEREEIGDRALLYTWGGRDPKLAPAVMCAHFDVVPADAAALWTHAPFSGDIADACVWGRGCQDIKCTLVSALHAAERLVGEGFVPGRTIYFAFGGDEEIGGSRGARLVGEELARRGVKASFLLDEGGPVSEGMIGFADRPLALVGVAEKGYMDVTVEARGTGGHASTPPRRTATGNLARAVAAIESSPSRTRLVFTVRSFLDKIAPYSPFPIRFLVRNLWLFGPLVKRAFGFGHMGNAMIRSTYAPTMLRGSAKENVLADSASANVNVRILPGQSSEDALARISKLVRPYGAVARVAYPESLVEPLPESPVDHEGYRAIEAALARAFPDAACVPFLFCAGTDTKHYRSVAEAMYRFTPLNQSREQLERLHGRDERVELANLRRCEIFYKRLLGSL
jgi:carboxypeptidase PM20D1